MKLTIFTELELTDEKAKELASIIGCKENKLNDSLKTYSQAALSELLDMILGEKVFSRISDVNEYRLFLMIKHVLSGDIPTESFVSNHFQTTPSASRSMINSVMSKYQNQLKSCINDYMKKILEGAKKNSDGEYEIELPNSTMQTLLNGILTMQKRDYIPVKKKRLSSSYYTMAPATHKCLLEYYIKNSDKSEAEESNK